MAPAASGSFLTRKIGPLPAWAWGGLAAAGIWFFFLRGQGSAGAAPGATGATGPAGFPGIPGPLGPTGPAAGPMPTPAPPMPASITPSTGRAYTVINQPSGYGSPAGSGQPGSGAPIYGSKDAASPFLGEAGWGSQVQSTGPPQPGRTVPGRGSLWIPLDNGGWIFAGDVLGGVGGPGRVPSHRSSSVGSRSSWLWGDAHPGIGAPVRYPHFVRAVGGAANHRREVHRVAAQSGVHPARMIMLNPIPASMIRVA